MFKTNARLRLARGWASGALALMLLGSCGPEPEPSVPAAPFRVVLGTGQRQFEVLETGANVPLIKGIQGGWHVWTSFLAYGFDTDVLRMDLTTRWLGIEESVLGRPGDVGVTPTLDLAGMPALVSVGWPAIVYNPTCAHEEKLRVELGVVDTEGRSASDVREWTMQVPEADRSSACGN